MKLFAMNVRRVRAIWPAFMAAFVVIYPVEAHHGEAAHYHLDQQVVIEGVITEFQLVNPHAYVYFVAPDDQGTPVQWRCEMGTNMRRHGYEDDSLVAGDHVRVTGNPARREANLCKLNSLEHEDGRTVLFRGPATEGTSSYTPSAAMLAFAPGNRTPSAAQDAQSDVLAVGSSAAKTRVIVPVPTEGMFGYWSAFPGGVVGVAGYRSRQVQFNSQLPVPTPYLAPDYKPEGAALAARYDESFDNPALGCESSVLDGIFHHGNINEFVQVNAQQIRWVYGYMDLVRTIHMGEHQIPEGTQPSTLGYSTGHWEGDTLVVRTGALKKQWLYDTENHADYVVASNQLQIEERITHDPDNDHLVIEYTATDPAFWTSPISGVLRLARSDTPYQAYNCVELAGENNRRPDGSTVFD